MNQPTDTVTATAAEQGHVLAQHAQYLISTAARAPSVHNSQPWQFRVRPQAIELWCDPQRKTQADPIGRQMLISCGAALFGLRLAVRSLGYQPVVGLLPNRSQLRFVARVGIGAAAPMNALEREMLAAVPHRHTHRGPFAPGLLPAGLLAGLQSDALTEGAVLALVEDGLAHQRLASIVAAAARRGDIDPGSRQAIMEWTRDQGSAARDGVPASAFTAAPPAQAPPGRLPQRDFDLGRGIARLPGGGAPPAVTAVLLTSGDRRADWVRAGQALQRLLLHAASKWVFASLYTQPLENAVTRALIRERLALPGYPQMLLQLGPAAAAASTARRPPGDLTTLALTFPGASPVPAIGSRAFTETGSTSRGRSAQLLQQTLEPVLRSHKFFAGLDPSYQSLLVGCASTAAFATDSYLFREGEPAQTFYLIRQGRVALEIATPARRTLVVQTLGAGDVAGFSWLIEPHRWEFDGRALERVLAVKMDGACLLAKCDEDPRLGVELMRRFAGLATSRLQGTRLQLLDVYGHVRER